MKSTLKYGLIFLFFFALSCKTGKEISSVTLPTMTAEERIGSIIQSGIEYNNLSSNLKLTVRQRKANKEIAVDAQLRIVKNEAIQMSLRIPVLGSEVCRILITPDKLLIIDRLNKQYLSENLQDLKTQIAFGFDFDYYTLEALLTNQLFIAGKKEITPADYAVFQIRNDNARAHITYSDQHKILYDFESDYTNHIQTARMEQENGTPCLQCHYTDWGSVSNNRVFPMTLHFRLQIPDGVCDLNCSYKSVVINTEFAIDYTIPNKYRQVSLQQMNRLI
ncbi:MAG: DUF4292 domain-containing protein [Dysgonamonadaceae bacterium]|nr:DUF4292 domain-containing protein [Dysgonamonadaceae bacterium]